MRILTLGGSNTGMSSGWVRELQQLTPEHEIENAFLGAVGSLYGLLRLLKRRQEGDARIDLLIFEYALNDTILFIGGNLDPNLIDPVLQDVMTLCAQEGVSLLFLCLCVRPPPGEDEAEASRFVDQIYVDAAAARGVADCILLREVLGRISNDQYSDQFHIKPEIAAQVAEALAERLKLPLPVPNGAARPMRFDYIPADRAKISGSAERFQQTSAVFEGPFIRLRRGGASLWRCRGRLVALLICVTEKSGDYRIRMHGWKVRKMAQSVAREDRPALMILHYVTGKPPMRRMAVVDLPTDETSLMRLPHDFTLMQDAALTPFSQQSLEIGGAIFLRRPSVCEGFAKQVSRLFQRG